MIRIDYLNKEGQVRHTFLRLDEIEIGCEVLAIIRQGATDICVYNLDKEQNDSQSQNVSKDADESSAICEHIMLYKTEGSYTCAYCGKEMLTNI